MKRRTAGLLAFAGAAAGGAALGYLGERRLAPVGRAEEDPRWAEVSSPPPVASRTVESFDGTQLHVVVAGPAGAPAIVLAHGYAMTWRFWHYQVRDLADEFRVVAYDQRGHADSDPAASGSYTTDALARDLRAVLDATTPDAPALVAGHSMGGMTIMAFADEFPDLVRERLVGAALLNTASSKIVYRGLLTGLAGTVGVMGRARRTPEHGWPLPGRGAQTDLGYLLTRHWSMTGEAPPGLVRFVEQLAYSCPVDVLAGCGRLLATLDLDAALEQLGVPTLVIAGRRDWLTPAWQGRALANALSDARLHELPEAGHMTPLEEPAVVTRLLREHARDCFAQVESGAA